ncbi:GNAT family N-acetyltransferase [Gelidibacter gilvus]|uniref:GNAT family N-acetyltransferase n=1 Tax=Gelidibacter gilvus TaxID=59602 RepID=A0A4Q0XG45_9FLAO|nr:GNAT family N-acetyltransferase [Gelidibacter gilvus]RXJ50201.1 GNAT family N-acetyltransferase [Gelidibacter gilvus]
MIHYTTNKNKAYLKGICTLQKANLKNNLSDQEIEMYGFVTVDHTLEMLEDLNAIEPQIVAKDDKGVIGYVLAMTKKSKFDIPIILPMFEEFEKIDYKGRWVSEYNYLVVGQVCVHKNYRGRGVFEKCFHLYKNTFAGRYDFAITEIAVTNQRSRKAHKKVGFEEIHTYTDSYQTEWVVVLWDWNDSYPHI